MIRKDVLCEFDASSLKALAGDGPGEWTATLSAPTIDRDREVIAPHAFALHPRGLPARIPIHVDHDMTTRGLVASAEPFYDDSGTLRARGVFASTEKAQDVRRLITEGHLKTMSVGFMDPFYDLSGGVPVIQQAELLEASFVSVPSNREALIDSIKAAKSQDPAEGSGSSTADAAAAASAAAASAADEITQGRKSALAALIDYARGGMTP